MKKTALIFLLAFWGCAGHFTVPSKEALQHPFPHFKGKVETTLIGAGLSADRLEREGIAVFAILKGGPETLRLNAAYELFQGLRSFFPDVRVVPHRGALERIRTAGRLPEYRAFIGDYEKTRVVDLKRLHNWGKMQGVRYLFIAQVARNDKHTSTRTMTLGEDGVGEKVSVFPSGPVHIPYDVEKEVSIVGEVWDSQCGQAVWIGTSHAEISEPVELERVRVEDIFTSVSRNLIESFNHTMNTRRRQDTPPDC
ncbi:MAG: hypothetical protein ACE5GK_06990 [Nitrospiria bacterium]